MRIKRKVLIICTNSDLAGAPIHVRDLALGLRKRNWKVYVVFGSKGEVSKQLKEADIDVSHIPSLRSNYNLIDDLKAIWALRKVLAVIQPDVVHCHSTKAGMIGRIVSSWFSIPAIYTIHGWGFGEGRGKFQNVLIKNTEKYLISRTSKYIAVSEFDKELGEKSLGIQARAIKTIYNGITAIKAPDRNYVGTHLVMVARIAKQKDHSTLLSALSKVKFDTITFIGAGTDGVMFINQAKVLMKANFNRARFIGETSDVVDHLKRSTVFILTSNYEGLPISIIEAMSMSLPVIATDVGGVRELVKHQMTGFLVKKTNVQEVVSAVTALHVDPDLRLKMGHAGRVRFDALFSFEICLNKTEAIYDEIIENH